MKSSNTFSHTVQSMPKAEIHIHLEGSIAPKTVLQLAKQNRLEQKLPTTDLAKLKEWFSFRDFPHFVQIYITIQDLLRTPADFELIAYECGADMHAQNIRYREVTITPYTHIELQSKGLKIGDILSGLNAGRAKARKKWGVEMRWVFDIPRNPAFDKQSGIYDHRPAEETLGYALTGQTKGVIALGLGGYEVGAPPGPFAHAFIDAKTAGLLSLPHGGETLGAPSVWGCINDLKADRIGHGVRAIEDPKLLDLLADRQIPLEINITSNEKLHIFPTIAEHPLKQLDQHGIHVTINSDDPPLFNCNLVHEYTLLNRHFGYTEAGIIRLARNAYEVIGCEPKLKETLLAEFDLWVSHNESKIN